MNTREIKFRVWDKQHNKMLPHVYKMGSGFPSPIYCYDLMQYTGLRDKNNKEIYEGDICFTESKEYAMNKQVIWNDRLACFEFDYPLGKSILQSDDIEVIGNIYETPNLIKNQTA